MSKVFVALGSNLGDREAHLLQGVQDIEQIVDCSGTVSSSIYETNPMGPQDQPDYLNSVCSFQCDLEPMKLLAELKQIERQHGRTQSTQRWTARPLDLDILLFGDRQIDTQSLTIPHIGIAQRSFVLWPLAELDETLQVPGLGSVSELMERCQRFGIKSYRSVRD
ncbi:MAG: 2-amino-4-hydroxy-6-hydroxymethyldihydropteridine diphosphokinase [Granulosicoccus sp.]